MELFAKEGDTVSVGGDLFKIELGTAPASEKAPASTIAPPKVELPKVEEPVKAAPQPVASSPSSAPPAAPKAKPTTAPPKKESTPVPSTTNEADIFPGYVPGVRTERAVSLVFQFAD